MRGTIEKEELLNFFSYIPAGSDEGRKLGQLVKQLETRPVHHVLESQRRDFARMDFVGVSPPSRMSTASRSGFPWLHVFVKAVASLSSQ